MAVPTAVTVAVKVATTIVTDKKLRRIVFTAILIAIVVICFPIFALMGIFGSVKEMVLDDVNTIIEEQKTLAEGVNAEISELMTEAGYSEQRIEEAQALYVFALLNYGKEEGFAEKYVTCYAAEQTDEELVENINRVFQENITVKEYTDAMQTIRDKYAEQEESQSG